MAVNVTSCDSQTAGILREAFARLGIEALAKRIAAEKGLSGKALQEAILVELKKEVNAARRWFEPGACFAAGTLVHTKDGLKPIEEIQVGDWVLSKPENGGEQAYKRVTQTFAYPPERVVRVEYEKPGTNGRTFSTIVCTPNHPFWTREEGWTAAIGLQGYGRGKFHFESADGNPLKYGDITNIYVSDDPDVGWTSQRATTRTDTLGNLRNYVKHRLVANGVPATEAVQNFADSPNPQELYFKLPVYNLEVEDFHTYYVGQHGVWVHNQNCGGLNFEALNLDSPVSFANDLPGLDMIGLTGRGLIAAGAMVIAFGSSDAVASSVQSQAGNDLSGFGKVLGMMIFGYVAIRLVRRREEAGRAGRGNQNRSVKPVYIWLVVLAGSNSR